jgi:hypothetical protein
MTWQAVERAYWAVIHDSEKRRRAEDEKNGTISFVTWASPRAHFSDPAELSKRLARHAADGQTARTLAAEQQAQCQILRDIFKPYCAVSLSHGWLTTTVKQMAAVIYRERDFNSLPILGDALEDAGCTEVTILDHLRALGPHVRGCWVVDLVLGQH